MHALDQIPISEVIVGSLLKRIAPRKTIIWRPHVFPDFIIKDPTVMIEVKSLSGEQTSAKRLFHEMRQVYMAHEGEVILVGYHKRFIYLLDDPDKIKSFQDKPLGLLQASFALRERIERPRYVVDIEEVIL